MVVVKRSEDGKCEGNDVERRGGEERHGEDEEGGPRIKDTYMDK